MINVICVHTAWLWWSLCCRTEWRWRDAQMFFGDDESTTAIQEHESHDCNATLSKRESHELSGEWYTLDGRRLGSTFNVPRNATLSPRERSTLKKGLYIVNGKKVVIK